MYPNHYHGFYHDPYHQLDYFQSTPYPSEDFYYDGYDERIFGPMGPPQGPPPGSHAPGQGSQSGPPSAPPPSYVPAQTQQATAFAVDPGSIRHCLFRYTYVWLNNRQQFWFYPTFVGRTSVSGWRWNGFRWLFFGISLRQIQSFTCI
ncbi:hypothetical protein R4Z09_14095 [Niallia oryzisoli]|uniref:Transporter n=1 Tax=Niallia oryzisoli TaxID=1737571 RepID=A0ABZ2CJP5_9BACI